VPRFRCEVCGESLLRDRYRVALSLVATHGSAKHDGNGRFTLKKCRDRIKDRPDHDRSALRARAIFGACPRFLAAESDESVPAHRIHDHSKATGPHQIHRLVTLTSRPYE
jgi:hypothetical protein